MNLQQLQTKIQRLEKAKEAEIKFIKQKYQKKISYYEGAMKQLLNKMNQEKILVQQQ